MVDVQAPPLGIRLNGVTFSYPNCPPFISNASLELPRGSRCLLIGANGTGKTTLLQMVAGEWLRIRHCSAEPMSG